VVGFSQGGLVAAEAAAIDDRLKTVLLWSPVANPPDTYKHILSDESVTAGLQSEGRPVAVTTMWGAPLELKTGFFADLFRYDPTAAITEVEDPLMVIVGLRDTTVTPQPTYGELYLTYHDGPEQLVTVDSDHVFNVVTDTGPQVFDDVVAWSVAWLEQTLPKATE
jgi:cephalosporin-C deacetylase-like acetyl esterase